jgi:hypothetical protein
VEGRSQVELPARVIPPFDVFIGGVQQQAGRDYRLAGRTLVFERRLSQEGQLGFWRWLSIFLGVAGTYRKNELVDIVYTAGGQRQVATLEPADVPERPSGTGP